MRAWTVPRLGPPGEVLTLAEVARPEPAPGQRLVRVHAAACNFADILYCTGEYQQRPSLPFTPGLEVAGEDVATGERVFGPTVLPAGGFAEYALLERAHPWPEGMDAAQACGFFVAYQTGWCALHHRTVLRAGETLLVHAAAGGVGAAAVQLGKAAGARVIAAVGGADTSDAVGGAGTRNPVGGADKVETARRLGADEVLGPDVDLITAVRELTDGRGADVVYDPVGGDTFDASRRVTAFEGRLLVIGFAGGRIADAPTNHALVKNYAVIGVHWAAYRDHTPELVQRWQRELAALWSQRRIDPLVGARYAFDQLPDALDALAARATTGRVVLSAPEG